jgi:threonine aldolase
MKSPRGFGSDNHSGVHPQILEAIAMANNEHAASYGTDEISVEANGLFKQKFGAQAQVQFVFNGTAANVMCLRLACESYHSVLCSDVSHLNVDECSAPEILGHCKLIPLKSTHGKITLQEAKKALIRKGDQHFAQVKVLSITQPTEYGTVYTYDEMKELFTWAKKGAPHTH